ncbi:MAG: RagB/SusD family nutrient uptake outer membrane protein [Gemmatimonadales bacterium]
MIAAAVLTTLGAITLACKDFLETPAQGTVDEATLATRSGVEGSLIAAYRSLDCSSSSAGSWGCAASNWVWGSVPSGDAYKGSNLGDQQPINNIETYLWSVGDADAYINQKWSQVYEGVSRANATLRLLDKVLTEKGSAEIDTTSAKGIRGEAIFLRAHYHFEAYRMWGSNTEGGTGGIPYYRQNDLDFRKTNVGVDAIANILADLDSAIALLPATPRNLDKGRATSWAARAYKGRVQVYGAAATPALWNAALATLTAVQTSGVYALETSFDRVWTGRPQFRNGPETILAFQASVRDGEPSGWNSNWGERLNFPHSGSHFGCCGFHQPSFNLLNFFRVDAAGLPVAITSSAWNSPAPDPVVPPSDTGQVWAGFNFRAGNSAAVDPRLDWTAGRDNVPYKDWGLHNRSWIRDASYSGPYSVKKNVHEQSDAGTAENNVGWQATQTNNVNLHIFRYADMLLLLAEAEVEVGSLINAANIVNQIRARAAQAAQGCGSADTVVTNAYPACASNNALQPMAIPLAAQSATLDTLTTPWGIYRIGRYPVPFPDQATARRAVRYERRLELAMEGQRFFDLRRWGGADTVIANYIATETNRIPYLSLATTFTLPKYGRYPIPTVQIDLSRVGTEDRLQQNPGW